MNNNIRYDNLMKTIVDEFTHLQFEPLKIVICRENEVLSVWEKDESMKLMNQYSLTKSFLSVLVGILYYNNMLNLDNKLTAYFDESYFKILKQTESISTYSYENLTLTDLLCNASGIENGFLFEKDRHNLGTNDYLSYIFSQPLQYAPKEKFVYSNSNYYLISRAIENVCHDTLPNLFKKYLFTPIGIENVQFDNCPLGFFLGGSGLYLSTLDVAKLGILMLSDGKINGVHLLSKDYADMALSKVVAINSNEGYGLGFMMKDTSNTYGTGRKNQILFMNKPNKIVVAVNSDCENSKSSTMMKVIRRILDKIKI